MVISSIKSHVLSLTLPLKLGGTVLAMTIVRMRRKEGKTAVTVSRVKSSQ